MRHRTDEPRDLPASVRGRLLHLSRESGEDFQAILVRYATERVLYRLSRSEAEAQFVLKGAWLFYTWGIARRTTRDADFLGFGPVSPDEVKTLFHEILSLGVEEDGLGFEMDSISVEETRVEAVYPGVRVRFHATLGAARIPVQLDIGFGDAVEGVLQRVTLPTLLEFPPPELRAYDVETVVAEKTEAIVRFGGVNTRLKDFFDLFVLAREREVTGQRLGNQMKATFSRRGTPLPTHLPEGLGDRFARDTERRRQWAAFLRRVDATEEDVPDFPEVVGKLREFIWPPLHAVASGERFCQHRLRS